MDPSGEAGRGLTVDENENHGDPIKQLQPYLTSKLTGLIPFSFQSEIDVSDVELEFFVIAQRHVEVIPIEISDQLRACLDPTLQLILAEESRRAIRNRRQIALGKVEGGWLGRITDRQPIPVTAALRKDFRKQIETGLMGLSKFDRMIVRWKCFEPLGFLEIGWRFEAASSEATTKRCVRAIGRLSGCNDGGEE